MDKALQKEKIAYKMDIVTNLINDLIEYNSIEGYNNQKRFTIKIEYDKNPHNTNHYYSIKIIRGYNNPKNIFNMRFIYDENINNILNDLILNIIKSDTFLYTTYTTENKELPEKYNIFLKNDVIVTIDIKDKEIYDMTKKIGEQLPKEFLLEIKENTSKDKDELQKEKLIKIFNLFKNIFSILEYYNSIENYDNKKEYKLRISNYYNSNRECYIYNLSIIRGICPEEKLLELGISIKDNEIMYKMIYELAQSYNSKKTYIYDITRNSQYNGIYSIHMENNITLEFVYGNERDSYFYSELYTNNKLKNKNHTLKKIKENI